VRGTDHQQGQQEGNRCFANHIERQFIIQRVLANSDNRRHNSVVIPTHPRGRSS
jgi:hypothetical protein